MAQNGLNTKTDFKQVFKKLNKPYDEVLGAAQFTDVKCIAMHH